MIGVGWDGSWHVPAANYIMMVSTTCCSSTRLSISVFQASLHHWTKHPSRPTWVPLSPCSAPWPATFYLPPCSPKTDIAWDAACPPTHQSANNYEYLFVPGD